MGTLVWRVLGTGSAILAGIIASKAVTAAWNKAGRDSSLDPRDPRTPTGDAVAFAALMGLAVGAARVIATRKAAQYYAKSAGHLPKPMLKGEA
jgi:hypothetical protein